MIVKCKCMLLEKGEATNRKTGEPYKFLKFLEKGSNENIRVSCNDFGKFEKLTPYSDCEVVFNFYKDKEGNLRVGLGEL